MLYRLINGAAELQLRLDQVDSINTESPGIVAALLHPFRPLLVAVDPVGVVRVYSSRKPYALKNAFYVSTGAARNLRSVILASFSPFWWPR